jgi:hypothetical protein
MGSSFGNVFTVGDLVEADLDGRPRTVTEATDDYVAFEPPLKSLHHYGWNILVNWKNRKEFLWDLRISDDSPARKMGDQGQDVGSTIDMQAYIKGDFNGDGSRDLPELPVDVRAR